MTEKKKIDVMIDGRKFTVVGDEDEEYILSLSKFVDKNIKKLSSKNSFLSQTMSATLAALNITDELFKTKMELDDLGKKAKEPLEKYENVKVDLNAAKEEIKSLKLQSKDHKDTILSLNQEKSKMEKEIQNYIKANSEMEMKIKKSEETIKSLQDKNFKNQMEIVEIKKELKEYIKLLEIETEDK